MREVACAASGRMSTHHAELRFRHVAKLVATAVSALPASLRTSVMYDAVTVRSRVGSSSGGRWRLEKGGEVWAMAMAVALQDGKVWRRAIGPESK